MKTPDQIKPTFAPVYCTAFYPDMAKICIENGYALAVHGSLQKDLDLIAIPWVENPTPREEIVKSICEKFELTIAHHPDKPAGSEKPHGRIVYTLIGSWGHWYIDLGFMPTTTKE